MTDKTAEREKQAASDALLADLEALMERYDARPSQLEEMLGLSRGFISRMRGGKRVLVDEFKLRYAPFILDLELRGEPPRRPLWLARKKR